MKKPKGLKLIKIEDKETKLENFCESVDMELSYCMLTAAEIKSYIKEFKLTKDPESIKIAKDRCEEHIVCINKLSDLIEKINLLEVNENV